MIGYSIECDERDIISVAGRIDLSNIVAVRDQGIALMALLTNVEEISIDLRGLQQVNSACLALLIAWTRYAKQHAKQIIFQNVPSALVSLGRVNGVDSILPIEH